MDPPQTVAHACRGGRHSGVPGVGSRRRDHRHSRKSHLWFERRLIAWCGHSRQKRPACENERNESMTRRHPHGRQQPWSARKQGVNSADYLTSRLSHHLGQEWPTRKPPRSAYESKGSEAVVSLETNALCEQSYTDGDGRSDQPHRYTLSQSSPDFRASRRWPIGWHLTE